jgi:sigma-54-dependent transcriptional regulator
MIARRIHQRSSRNRKPFLKLNCARLTDSEIGRELLRRSGPGAVRRRLLDLGSGGTVFLVEVGALPLVIQAELLRAVGDAEVLSATSADAPPLDVRFISSTSNDFGELIGGGAFRSDLHYWLGGIHLYVPPLRERADEILRLARQFLDQASVRLALPPMLMSEAAEAWLMGYPWPSNIRELREVVVEAGTAAAPDRIEVAHLEMGLDIVHSLGLDPPPGVSVPSSERSTIPGTEPSDEAATSITSRRPRQTPRSAAPEDQRAND